MKDKNDLRKTPADISTTTNNKINEFRIREIAFNNICAGKEVKVSLFTLIYRKLKH